MLIKRSGFYICLILILGLIIQFQNCSETLLTNDTRLPSDTSRNPDGRNSNPVEPPPFPGDPASLPGTNQGGPPRLINASATNNTNIVLTGAFPETDVKSMAPFVNTVDVIGANCSLVQIVQETPTRIDIQINPFSMPRFCMFIVKRGDLFSIGQSASVAGVNTQSPPPPSTTPPNINADGVVIQSGFNNFGSGTVLNIYGVFPETAAGPEGNPGPGFINSVRVTECNGNAVTILYESDVQINVSIPASSADRRCKVEVYRGELSSNYVFVNIPSALVLAKPEIRGILRHPNDPSRLFSIYGVFPDTAPYPSGQINGPFENAIEVTCGNTVYLSQPATNNTLDILFESTLQINLSGPTAINDNCMFRVRGANGEFSDSFSINMNP